MAEAPENRLGHALIEEDTTVSGLPRRHERDADEPQQSRDRGHGRRQAQGAFMGAGPATAEATFKPEMSGPSFAIGVRIEEVDVTRLNDLFRAYGRFDTSSGRLLPVLRARGQERCWSRATSSRCSRI